MDLWAKIASSRDGFGVRCGVRNRSFDSPEALAGEFGLRSSPNIYLEVDEQAAQAILQKLLHEDMAYQSELLPAADVAEITKSFLELFRDQDGRYFSNGNWHLPLKHLEPRVWVRPGWMPATDATFDGGILAIGRELSGCVWFEDED